MSVKSVFKCAVVGIFAALFLTMIGCGPDPYYIRVVHITGVPETGEAGKPISLTGTVRPVFASNIDIIWSVKDAGTTGAVISGNVLKTNADGTVVITARISNGRAVGKDFTQDFIIVIGSGAPPIPNKEYIIEILIFDAESGDIVTVSPDKGVAGDSVTLSYTVADIKHYNQLDFGGVTASIAPVESAGSGTRTYTISAADSSNGVITITAVFTHTDLEIDPIAFANTAGHITRTYGDPPFTNAITNAHKGSGAITYHSSDTNVALADGSGQVTILKTGSAVISAEKAADEKYAHAQTVYTLTVNPKPVTITGLSAANKYYDGTTAATVTGTAVINGKVDGDMVTVSPGTASFADSGAGDNKIVTFNGWSLDGSDAGNYTLSAQPTPVTANIMNHTLSGTVTISPNSGVIVGTELTAVYSGNENVSYQWRRDGVNVGENSNKYTPARSGSYTVTISAVGYNSKTSAAVVADYKIELDIIDNVSGDTVTASPDRGLENVKVTLTYTVAKTKFYNQLDFGGVTAAIASVGSAESGTRIYTIHAADASKGVITITAIFSHTDLEIDHIAFSEHDEGHITKTYGDTPFTNAITDAHHGKGAITYHSSNTNVATVNGSGRVTILNAGSAVISAEKAADEKYAYAQTIYTLTVNPKPVTITGLSADNKVYDGTTTAAVTGTPVIDGKVGNDTVTVSTGTASFASAAVGNGKTVTFSGYSLTGADATQYTLSAQPASVTANITAKSVTITGLSASNKVYDGTTAAAVSGSAVINGRVGNDTVTVSTGTASFASAAVGDNKTVTFNGWSLTGADAGNYTLSAQPANATANITPKPVTITGLSASNKVYDGTATATVTGTPLVDGKVAGDTVTVVAGTASFADAAAGNNKTVTFSDWSLGGNDAGNYTLSGQPAPVTANITLPSFEIIIDWTAIDEWQLIEQTAQAAANTDKEFTVTGSYATGCTYQWYLDGELVGTSSSYTFKQPADVYQLVVVVTNSKGEKRSGRCRITVNN